MGWLYGRKILKIFVPTKYLNQKCIKKKKKKINLPRLSLRILRIHFNRRSPLISTIFFSQRNIENIIARTRLNIRLKIVKSNPPLK